MTLALAARAAFGIRLERAPALVKVANAQRCCASNQFATLAHCAGLAHRVGAGAALCLDERSAFLAIRAGSAHSVGSLRAGRLHILASPAGLACLAQPVGFFRRRLEFIHASLALAQF